jgi:hypothetical protein
VEDFVYCGEKNPSQLLGLNPSLCARFVHRDARWIFSNQNARLVGIVMDEVGILKGYLVYFSANGYILWPFGIFYGYLVYFRRFGLLYRDISGNSVCTYLW